MIHTEPWHLTLTETEIMEASSLICKSGKKGTFEEVFQMPFYINGTGWVVRYCCKGNCGSFSIFEMFPNVLNSMISRHVTLLQSRSKFRFNFTHNSEFRLENCAVKRLRSSSSRLLNETWLIWIAEAKTNCVNTSLHVIFPTKRISIWNILELHFVPSTPYISKAFFFYRVFQKERSTNTLRRMWCFCARYYQFSPFFF